MCKENLANRQALSLPETIVALFIITVGVLGVAGLYQNAWASQRRAANMGVATVIANKNIAEIRSWASSPTNFANWSAIDGKGGPDSEFPDFFYQTDSEAVVQYSPCSLSEKRFPVADQRIMNRSLRKLRVTVGWDKTKPKEKIDIVVFIGSPIQALADIGPRSAFPAQLDPLAETTNQVYATDSVGREIPDLFYQWSLGPQPGIGSLSSVSRDGRTITFKNQNGVDEAGNPIITAGNCDITVLSRYAGTSTSYSTTLGLKP